MAATYLGSDGDIKAVLRTLVQSPEFNSRRYFRNKVKTPTEFIASAFRTTATDPQNPGALVNTLKQMGMPPYDALPPTGYYLTADQWMNTTALVDRLNFAYQLTTGEVCKSEVRRGACAGVRLVVGTGAGGAAGGFARADADDARGDGERFAGGECSGRFYGVARAGEHDHRSAGFGGDECADSQADRYADRGAGPAEPRGHAEPADGADSGLAPISNFD